MDAERRQRRYPTEVITYKAETSFGVLPKTVTHTKTQAFLFRPPRPRPATDTDRTYTGGKG